MRKTRIGRRAVLVLAAISAAPPITAWAATSSWTFNGNGNWTLASNWSGGVPVAGSDVFSRHNDAVNRTINYDYAGASILLNGMTIENTGSGSEVFSQNANTFNAPTETIGNSGTGYWSLGGGTHNISVVNPNLGLAFGSMAGSKGIGTMSSGALNAGTAQIFVGYFGTGSLTQTGGTLSAYYLTAGWQGSGNGTYTLNGGTANISNGLFVGYLGTGTLNMGGGTLNPLGPEYIGEFGTGQVTQTAGAHIVGTQLVSTLAPLYLGYASNGVGTYLLSGTGSLTVNGVENVGFNGSGTFNQSAGAQQVGSAIAAETIDVGVGSTATGNYFLSGSGSLSVIGDELIGDLGAGTFTQSGGTQTIGTTSASGILALGVSSIALAHGNGTYTLSSTGALTVIGAEYVGYAGVGTFNQMGGTNIVGTPAAQGSLTLAGQPTGAGTYLLNGGTLIVNGEENIGELALGTMIQNGGTHIIGTSPAPGIMLSLDHAEYDLGGTGVLNVNGTEIIGATANTYALFDQQGGTHTVGSAAAAGTLQMEGFGHLQLEGGTLTVFGSELLGGGTPAGGYVYQPGGTHVIGTAANPGFLGIDGGGIFDLEGGTLAVNGDEWLGYNGTGLFVQNGGVHTVGSVATAQSLYVGYYSPASFQLGGNGSLTVYGTEYIGTVATGTFTQTGGTHTVTGPFGFGYLEIGGINAAPALGVYQLDGGSLTVNGFAAVGGYVGGPGETGILNIQGGAMSVSNTLQVWDDFSTAVNLSGGALSVGSLDTENNPSRFNWTAGTFTVTGVAGLTIGNTGPLGLNVSLNGVQALQVPNTTTLSPLSQIVLNGGTFTTGSVIGSGHLIINTGTFQLTNSNIALGPGGPLANTLQLNNGANIVVSGAGDGFAVPAGGLLQLNGGALAVTGAGGFLTNIGELLLTSPLSLISGATLNNTGSLSGTGRISSPLLNSSGQVSVGATDTLMFQGAGNSNGSRMTLGGGTIAFAQGLTNTGTISGRGTFIANPLTNSGTVQFSAGFSDVYGAVTNTGRITVTGGSTTTFYNNVDTSAGGASITVNNNSTVVFLGSLLGQSKVTGPGLKDFEGSASGGPIATVFGSTLVGVPGQVTTQYFNENDLTVYGSASVLPNGTAASFSRANTLGIFGGTLDLNDNDLIVNTTAMTTVASYIVAAYSHGSWTGAGLTSSFARAAAGSAHPTALGYATASSIGVSVFDGQSVSGSNVLVRYTYSGDANLDGVVNALDFNAVATNFGSGSGKFWVQGDFNYDGFTNTLDFTLLGSNFNQVLPAPALGTLVPEPCTLFLAVTLLCRKRRRGA